ncbi:MAG: FAD-binding protein, partial [bacterium]
MSKPAMIQEGVSLAPLTTYRIGGVAEYYCAPQHPESLIEALCWAKGSSLPIFVLGGGSNVLFADRGLAGLVVHLCNFLSDLDRASRFTEQGECQVGGGVPLTPWVRRCIGQGYSGVEALIGIPGTVGGGLHMNAGAFGMEISYCLRSVDILNEDLQRSTIPASALKFDYRRVTGLEGKLVLSACFRLQSGDPEQLLLRAREIVAARRQQQPLEFPSCGSVFKRPPGDFAGRLIEAAGLKGR